MAYDNLEANSVRAPRNHNCSYKRRGYTRHELIFRALSNVAVRTGLVPAWNRQCLNAAHARSQLQAWWKGAAAVVIPCRWDCGVGRTKKRFTKKLINWSMLIQSMNHILSHSFETWRIHSLSKSINCNWNIVMFPTFENNGLWTFSLYLTWTQQLHSSQSLHLSQLECHWKHYSRVELGQGVPNHVLSIPPTNCSPERLGVNVVAHLYTSQSYPSLPKKHNVKQKCNILYYTQANNILLLTRSCLYAKAKFTQVETVVLSDLL